jgi:hypothetical protein
LQNILKCRKALWRMTPKNYELGGVYNTNSIQCHFFAGGKEWHTNQRIVKWMTNQNAKVLPLFYAQFWFLNLYVEVNKFHVFLSYYMFSIFSPGRIWNWREIMNEQKKSTVEMLNRQQTPCGF